MNKKEELKGKLQKNKFNIITILVAVISVIVYLIFLCIWKKWSFTSEKIVPLTADWITIVACVLALIQLVAFIVDSRNKESRSRKEAALALAEKYAQNIIESITFIQNVLTKHYNKTDWTALEKLVLGVELDGFTKDSLEKKSELKEYAKIFSKNPTAIEYDTIKSQAIIFQKISLFDIEAQPIEAQKQLINNKFRVHLCYTMNVLECFAMSVNQNVAESDMLYVSIHQTFLKFVHYMYPYICMWNTDGETYYPNIIELYKKWNKKRNDIEIFKKEQAKNQQQKMSKKVNTSSPLKW